MNVYAYCHNNPVTYIDSEGTQMAATSYQYTPSSSTIARNPVPTTSSGSNFVKGFATGVLTVIVAAAVVAAVVAVAPIVGVALAAAGAKKQVAQQGANNL